MTFTGTKHLWQPENYHHHSSTQKDAAIHLLQQIRLKGSELVRDIGCGDGKITAKIANGVPNGSVLGIDIAPEMIDFASLRQLPLSLREIFFKKVIDRYLEINPPSENGEIIFKFLRLDLIASKSNP